MNARESRVIIEYNGVDATEIITKELSAFSFTDNASGQADTASLTLSNRTGRWLKKGYYPEADDYIKAWIKVENWKNGGDSKQSYFGRFEIDSCTVQAYPSVIQIKGISVPIQSDINVTEKSRTWKKTTVKTIMSDIAKAAKVALVFDATDISIEEEKQNGKNDLSFAYSLCQSYGLCIKLYNEKLVVYDQTKYEKRNPSYTIDVSVIGGSGAYSYRSDTSKLYDSVKIKYAKDKDSVEYSYKIPGKKGNRTLYITTKADNVSDAELKAKAQLRENLRKSRTLMLSLMGDPKYKAAENIKIVGAGVLDGIYFVDSVTHTKNARSGYNCSLSCHPVVIDF